ncbi:terminase TerL endonuclease subunit [Shimia sp. MIT1388]|uniref:terminase TerL endonuclease subunit n=1 Tax=Shimia sp. MIT1388 TaxID=3096992 RepID=UPI00399B1FF3
MQPKYIRPTTTANPLWMHAPDAQSLVPVLLQNAELADKFIHLCGKFRMTQGQVAGLRLEECWLPWQKDALRASFQVRNSLWILGKGSGKSVSIAAFALGFVMLSANLKINTRGLVAVVAPTIQTARIVFDHVLEAVLSDEELRPMFRTNAQSRSLIHDATGMTIQILSCDMQSAVGKRPNVLILDETHELANISAAPAVVHQLRLGGANWGSSFKMLSISTMPVLAPKGEFKRQLNYAKSVRDGTIKDDDFLPLLFTFPMSERPDLDPLDHNHWWRGMPSLRTDFQQGTMDADELRRELAEASESDDLESFSLTLSQRLGIERNENLENAETVLHAEWKNCAKGTPVQTSYCAVGVDAGGVDDPMAVAIARRPQGNAQALQFHIHQFLTTAGFERATSSMQEVYEEAQASKTLHIFDRVEQCDDAVFDLITQAQPDHVGGDEHGRAGFTARLREVTGREFISVPQNWQLSAALASLESRLLDGAIQHNGCPLVASNVENLLVEELASGNRRLKKRDNLLSGQGYMKIDGIIAAINAVSIVDNYGSQAFDPYALIG